MTMVADKSAGWIQTGITTAAGDSLAGLTMTGSMTAGGESSAGSMTTGFMTAPGAKLVAPAAIDSTMEGDEASVASGETWSTTAVAGLLPGLMDSPTGRSFCFFTFSGKTFAFSLSDYS